MKDLILDCPANEFCRGCDHVGDSLETQSERKIRELERLLADRGLAHPSIDFLSAGDRGLRDRLDFVLEDGRLGLFRKDRHEILDLAGCPQLSPRLDAWLREFRSNLPKVRKGSVRLRVAPDGTRGMWLDFANVDIKTLLDDGDWLRSWASDVIIEMGQRKKRVRRGEGPVKLADPVLFPWFETKLGDKIIPLYGYIGSFTQPSLAANKLITEWIERRVRAAAPKAIVEFGSGQGNLSFPALASGAGLVACESDRGALEGFTKSLDVLAERGLDLRAKTRIEAGDFIRKPSDEVARADFLLVNPPRSGLGVFLDPIAEARELRDVLYMSCHPPSFAEDGARLRDAGFALVELAVLDQFPQTKHFEVLSLWRKITSTKSI